MTIYYTRSVVVVSPYSVHRQSPEFNDVRVYIKKELSRRRTFRGRGYLEENAFRSTWRLRLALCMRIYIRVGISLTTVYTDYIIPAFRCKENLQYIIIIRTSGLEQMHIAIVHLCQDNALWACVMEICVKMTFASTGRRGFLFERVG